MTPWKEQSEEEKENFLFKGKTTELSSYIQENAEDIMKEINGDLSELSPKEKELLLKMAKKNKK